MPKTVTRRARVTAAAATPTRAERHWRVTPTASTIVTASTNSTADAKKLETIVTTATEYIAQS